MTLLMNKTLLIVLTITILSQILYPIIDCNVFLVRILMKSSPPSEIIALRSNWAQSLSEFLSFLFIKFILRLNYLKLTVSKVFVCYETLCMFHIEHHRYLLLP